MDVDEPVVVVEYDPGWPRAAQVEVARLGHALRGFRCDIEHVGSTAVPGCAAKPIVDLLVGTSSSETHAVADAIVELGYESMGEAEPGRIYFRRRQSGAYNVHVVEMGGSIWTDNLALRNYLRAHPREGDRYGIAKRQAAAAHSMLLAYSREKAQIMAELLERARR